MGFLDNLFRDPNYQTTDPRKPDEIDDPEIIILAFAYHGGEGGSVAAPIVARVMQAYFELKSIDLGTQGGG